MSTRKKLLLAGLAVAAMLSLTTAAPHEHDCSGADCPICWQLAAAQQLLSGFTAAIIFAFSSLVVARQIPTAPRRRDFTPLTPVALNVQLTV
ncbi:MAG: hypothetical protein LBP75_07995 [Planctomycetota bacterium]|jgi:hypothetical protein|nr:hypothetical protein [Planctomycetota bacterium]